ncbi:MAG: hypothetical protein JST59_29760 [Actinobacteria bacterium]|nr:hypothetical protein [Actinomycetota bacterium]
MDQHDFIDMGGSALVMAMSDHDGIGVMSGAINGTAYGKHLTELKDVGDGRLELAGIHYFLDRDGSHLYTEDTAMLRTSPDTDIGVLTVTYKVAQASGRFEGYAGRFQSIGVMRAGSGEDNAFRTEAEVSNEKMIGVVRFEGRLYRS